MRNLSQEYETYCELAESHDYEPSDFQTWLKETKEEESESAITSYEIDQSRP